MSDLFGGGDGDEIDEDEDEIDEDIEDEESGGVGGVDELLVDGESLLLGVPLEIVVGAVWLGCCGEESADVEGLVEASSQPPLSPLITPTPPLPPPPTTLHWFGFI